MKHWLSKTSALLTAVLLITTSAHTEERIADQRVAIQLLNNVETITFQVAEPFQVSTADQTIDMAAGVYSFTPETVHPAQQRFHLFAKTFQLDEGVEEAAYQKSWEARGHTAESVVVGKQLKTDSGRILDARVHWISIVQTPTEAEALAQQKALNAAEQWTWVRQELTQTGSGTVHLRGTAGAQTLTLPIRISATCPITVANVDVGFWDTNKQRIAYNGDLEVTVTPEGKLELLEHLTVEEYLQGVLPSEMPSAWPIEALKAQAVAARSEVLVNLSTKHTLELFDFCSTEHCRAYRGLELCAPETNDALHQTQGEILVHDNRIAQALFSANCGGWTENNDTVWFGPENGALRGRPDLLSPLASPFGRPGKIQRWLTHPPEAYCDGDSDSFRWTRTYSEGELKALIEKEHRIGSIQRIELGERGVSGRFKWIRIHNTKETVFIKKELPIRQALGGLPSAMFDLTVSGSAPNRIFTIHGAGRGHGVGLCQHGANGMAKRGHNHHEILQHYFSDITIERIH